MTETDIEWWKVHSNIVELAEWMHENWRFDTVTDVIYFFDKPWKYEDEWNEYQSTEREQ